MLDDNPFTDAPKMGAQFSISAADKPSVDQFAEGITINVPGAVSQIKDQKGNVVWTPKLG